MSGVAKKLMGAAGGGEPEGAWDLSYAYYDDPFAWNLSTAVYAGAFADVTTQEATPQGVFFKSDGTKMYIAGASGDGVDEYTLSTPWQVSTASVTSFFSVGAALDGVFLKPDGTKMYVVSSITDLVYEYDLSTAWTSSTASLVRSKSISPQTSAPNDVQFKTDGSKMYVLDFSTLYEYDLSTAWDISTASYLQSFNVGVQENTATGVSFKTDGTKMYVCGYQQDTVLEYNLSIAWDISTASYVQGFGFSAQTTTPHGIYVRPDGGGFYIVEIADDRIYQYTLGGFRDITNAGDPRGLFFREDGEKLYIASKDTEDVVEYDISTPWDVSSASYVRSFPLALQEGNPVGIFFKPDGTQMFICGFSGEDVNEYSLSTAWNVSTASFVRVFSVSAQDTTPGGLSFKPDGTKMYVLGNAGDDVNEYNLSTAWNISTASFVQNFSVAAQEGFPRGLFFRTDGLKMYVVGFSLDRVNEYDLSTAWDISAASFVQSFSVAAQETVPSGLFFKDDGTQMFVSGEATDAIYSYTLGVQP